MTQAPLILLVETATESCSVAISKGRELISEKYINSPKVHASVLASFIRDILLENNISIKDLDAVAVSEGPGSYTGLRVGASCVKGICFGANIPLIGICTLVAIAQETIDNIVAIDSENNSTDIVDIEGLKDIADYIIVPMIDAGRMEVYTATFNSKGEQTSKTQALILDENSFKEELSKAKVIFTGNGAEKFYPLVKHNQNAILMPQMPHAKGLRIKANESYQNKEFNDYAYFEPFYLKDFIAGKPKKIL